MSRTAKWIVSTPLLVSVLVPMWLVLSLTLRYEILFAPEPMEPRFDWAWLSDIFYAVWWPLLHYFIVPGGIIAYPVLRFLPPWLPVRLTLSGLVAGLAYSFVLFLGYLLFRGIFRRRSRNA